MEKLLNKGKNDIHFHGVMAVGAGISDLKQASSKLVDNEVEDDVDCVILDENPDKPISSMNDGGDNSDDLCLVAENGQVACRDYPHPRHLCVKFPFNSTPHESYCEKCHCYVCESVAPCVRWGNGVSGLDHCHASEKYAFWRAYRKCAKISDKVLAFDSKVRLTPTSQLHKEKPPADQLCFVPGTGTGTGTGTPNSVQECGCHVSNDFQPYLVNYHLQSQSVGHIGKQVVSEEGVTPVNQAVWLPRNNPLMHNKEPPADKLCSVANIGTPYGAQVSGYHPYNNFQRYLVLYNLQSQSVGQADTQFVSERGITPINQVISPYGAQISGCHSSNKFQPCLVPNLVQRQSVVQERTQFVAEEGLTAMHSEKPPASPFCSINSTGKPYGAQVSGCHVGYKFQPNLVHYISQRQSVDYARTQLVSMLGLTPINQVLSFPSNNPLLHNEEPPVSQCSNFPGSGTLYGAQESGCHPGNNFRYQLQRKKVGLAGSQLIPPHVSYKRRRTSGGALSNTGYLSSSSRKNIGHQFSAITSHVSRWQYPTEMGNPMLTTNAEGVAANSVLNSPSWSPVGTEMPNYPPLEAQIHSHIPRGGINANLVAPRPQLSSQTGMGRMLSNLGMAAAAPGVATQQRQENPQTNTMYWQLQADSQQPSL